MARGCGHGKKQIDLHKVTDWKRIDEDVNNRSEQIGRRFKENYVTILIKRIERA